MSRRSSRLVAVVFALLAGYAPVSHAYHDRTHNAINVGASRASNLDTRLRNDLRFENGTNQIIVGKRVIDWIGEAGVLEDVPVARTRNHFHQPLRSPWRSAGLDDGLLSGTSSILWGQDANQGFSWGNARKAYINGLTAASPADREKWFAETFRAIGQVMHLIADSSVPAHVRNDQHTGGDPYEEWVELEAEARNNEKPEEARERFLGSFAESPIRPDRSILDIPILGQDAVDAPVPIARIWDTDRYDGTNPAITSQLGMGITEYSNANFFSDDTVFANRLEASHKHFSPFPTTAGVEEWVDTSNNRKYWRKRADAPGEPVQHLATVSKRSFWRRLSGVGEEIRGGLDDKVHEEYARLLVPRAVGYSAALLNYFFRGTFDFLVSFQPQFEPDSFGTIITNTSGERMEGNFTAYIDDTNGIRSPLEGASFDLSLGPGANSTGLQFPLSPPTSERSLVLVFQGRLGNEDGAVAAKIKKVGGPHWVATGSAGLSAYRIPGIEPITVTMKFKNVQVGRIEALAVDEDGGPATDLITGAGTGSLEVAGSQPDFTTFTVTLKPPIPRRPVATQLSVGATLNPGGFICISEISGLAKPHLVNADNSGFGPAACPE